MFSLLEQPWIGGTHRQTGPVDVGLLELFATAHEMEAVRHPHPQVEAGLLRLLIAVCLDAHVWEPGKEWRTRDLERALEEGRFDPARFAAYFEHHKAASDLFGERPFLQHAGYDGEVKPVANLVQAQPSGTNSDHFGHGREADFALCPAEAARQLCAIAPFATEGGRGYSPSVNGAPPRYVFPLGESLFHTILLNCQAKLREDTPNAGPPAWRAAARPAKELRTVTYGEALTYRGRSVLLIPGAGGVCSITGLASDVLVREMRYGPGDKWVAETRWKDPNVAYRETNNGISPIRYVGGRELVRDIGALTYLRGSSDDGKTRYERPAVIDQLAVLAGHEVREAAEFRVAVYGLRVEQKSKIFEWERAEASVPLRLLEAEPAQIFLQAEIAAAERVAYRLRTAVKGLAKEGAKSLNEGIAAGAERALWAHVGDAFPPLMREATVLLAVPGADPRPLRDGFRDLLAGEALRIFREIADRSGDTGDDFLIAAELEGKLGYALYEYRRPEDAAQKTAERKARKKEAA